MDDWKPELTDLFERRIKKFRKRHPNEIIAVLHNLDKFMEAVNAGTNPYTLTKHNERKGVYAIDQNGHGSNLRETRLYIYPDIEAKIVYLINIGDKSTQKRRDVPECHKFVEELRRTKENG